MLKSNINNNSNKIKSLILKHKGKSIICIFVSVLILFSIIYPFYGKKSKLERVLYDNSRINGTISIDDGFFNSFALSLCDKDKIYLQYDAKNTFFDFVKYGGNENRYIFGYKEYSSDNIWCTLGYTYDFSNDYFKNETEEYEKYSDSLVYKKEYEENIVKYTFYDNSFYEKNRPYFIKYSLTSINFYSKHLLDFLDSMVKEITKDDNSCPFLRDKVTCANMCDYTLKNYNSIQYISNFGVTVSDENLSVEFSLGNEHNSNLFKDLLESKEKDKVKDFKNMYFDSINNEFLMIKPNQICRFSVTDNSYNATLKFMSDNFYIL